jgi:hypothetical protein
MSDRTRSSSPYSDRHDDSDARLKAEAREMPEQEAGTRTGRLGSHPPRLSNVADQAGVEAQGPGQAPLHFPASPIRLLRQSVQARAARAAAPGAGHRPRVAVSLTPDPGCLPPLCCRLRRADRDACRLRVDQILRLPPHLARGSCLCTLQRRLSWRLQRLAGRT